MKHETKFDPQTGIMYMKIKGSYTIEEAIETEKFMKTQTKDRDSYMLLADLREAPASLDKEVRRRLQGEIADQELEKVAMIVTNPGVRMIGKIVIATMGKSKNTRFFKTEEEALAWLKGN